MTNLNNKVQEFRRHFNITKSFKDDQVFKLDPKGNLIADGGTMKIIILQTKEIQQSFFLFQRCNIS